jgi:hypothetical protein
MEIYRLKTELDSLHVTQTSLKDILHGKEDELRCLHERIIDVRDLYSYATFYRTYLLISTIEK